MMTPSWKIRATTALAALALMLGVVTAPVFASTAQSEEKQKKRKPVRELDDVFKRWLKDDVAYIISPEERDAFKKLATDEEREKFIEEFWLRRDPDPSTPENETRDEHYRRIAYANERFTSGIPGWKTDRGRVYIAWGKPDSIESYPTGQMYHREQWEGGGSTTTYAYEVWWYRYLEGVGNGLEIEFVDPTGTGEYRLASSPFEKDALLFVGNAGSTFWEQLGLENKGDRPAFGGNGNRYYNPPSNKTAFAYLERNAALLGGSGRNFKESRLSNLIADPAELETNALPFSVRADYFRVSDTSVMTSLTLQLDHQDLAFENKGGIYSATVNVLGRLTMLSGRTAGQFEEVIATPRYSDQDFALGQQQKSAFQKDILLAPGRYKAELLVRDTTSNKTGYIIKSFVVPAYPENKLGTSSVVLASKLEPLRDRSSTQFAVGQFKVIPNISNTYRVGQEIGVFLQVYDTQIDQRTLKPAVDVSYVILKDGKEIKSIADHENDNLYDLSGAQLAIGEVIPSTGLAPGTYTLQVRVHDRVAQRTLTPEAEFTIVE